MQLIVENTMTPPILEVQELQHTGQGQLGFGSTNDAPQQNTTGPTVDCNVANDHERPDQRGPPDKEPSISAVHADILNDLHLSYQPPYNIHFSTCPLGNQTF